MVRHLATRVVPLLIVLIGPLAFAGSATALTWEVTNPVSDARDGGLVKQYPEGRYRVMRFDGTVVGRVVKLSSTKWSILRGSRRIGSVKATGRQTFPFAIFNRSGDKIGRCGVGGPAYADWWRVERVFPLVFLVPPTTPATTRVIGILGGAPRTFPGAPTTGAVRLLLWD